MDVLKAHRDKIAATRQGMDEMADLNHRLFEKRKALALFRKQQKGLEGEETALALIREIEDLQVAHDRVKASLFSASSSRVLPTEP
ncbi:MAG: hypothetical protein OEV94_09050 [Deltaproteobacteria bacterium]|nr:hypothetical protein [Deltaproteobacteria bacterium]